MQLKPQRKGARVIAAAIGLFIVVEQPAAQDAGRDSGSAQAADPSPSPDARSDQPGRSQMLSTEQLDRIGGILERQGSPDEKTGLEVIEASSSRGRQSSSPCRRKSPASPPATSTIRSHGWTESCASWIRRR
jgi:hypothetical protein